MIWEYPLSIFTIYFTVTAASIMNSEEMPAKVLGVSRVWNEVKYELKRDHVYDAPVSTITSHGFWIRKSNSIRVLDTIYLLARIVFPPSDVMVIRSSIVVHGWQNVSLVNQMGWSFIPSIWSTVSSIFYLLCTMLYQKRYPGVGFKKGLYDLGGIKIPIPVTTSTVPPCRKLHPNTPFDGDTGH